MKNNILHLFAFNDLKNHRRDTKITIITIFIVSLIVMTLTFFKSLIINGDYINYQKESGTYTYSTDYYNYNEDNRLEKLKSEEYIVEGRKTSLQSLQHCFLYDYGYSLNNESMVALEGDYSILSISLKNGRMPEKENEIAIKKSVLDHWGYDEKLGNIISLSYVSYEGSKLSYDNSGDDFAAFHEFDKKAQISEFKIVGILEETGSSDIIVSKKIMNLFHLYIKTELNQETGHNYVIDNYEKLHLNIAPTIDNFGGIDYTNFILVLIQLLIIIISVSLIYGLTLSSFERKQKDFTLLRSIGATQSQIYYVIFIEAIILSVLPLFISLIIFYIISKCVSFSSLNLILNFDFLDMLWSAFVVLSIVFISYFVPARSVTRKALSGTFDGQEFQHFYYQYKKPHQLRPFYLAWRQLTSLKKKMIIKIFLITLVTIFSMILSRNIIMNFENKVILKEKNNITYKHILSYDEKIDLTDVNIYAENVYIRPFTIPDTLYENHVFMENDIVYCCPKIYCCNEDITKIYNVIALKQNQIIVSDNSFNSLNMSYKENDEIMFLGEKYELVDIVHDDENIVIVSVDVFKKYIEDDSYYIRLDIKFKDVHQKRVAMLECKEFMELQFLRDYTTTYHEDTIINIKQLFIQYLLIICCISVIYIYLYSFEIWKQREDIGSFQLLGLSKNEIFKIYFYKSFIICMFGITCGGIYYFLDLYYKYHALINMQYIFSLYLIVFTILCSMMIIILISFISLIPLKGILKKDAFENKNTRE